MGENGPRGSAQALLRLSAEASKTSSELEPRGSRLYGRSRGKTLRRDARERLQRLLPLLELNEEDAAAPAALFKKQTSDLWLEIGFGGGEHLVGQAAARPDVGFIGCEPFLNGVAKALSLVETLNLDNVRIFRGDALRLIARLPDASLGRLFVLFPDPWPKRRHNKRRVISEGSLAEFARALSAGAELRFATDVDDYAGWTLARALRSTAFRWRETGWNEPWPDAPQTRYQAKSLSHGRRPVYLTFERL